MLKKIPLIKKIITAREKSDTMAELGPANTDNLSPQKELDQKLVHSLNKEKIPSLKQFKYLSAVLNFKQRLLVKGLAVLIAISLVFMVGNFYFRNFLPSPTVGGEYAEGLIGAPQFINPLLSQTNDVDSDITRLIFSGLLKYDSQLQLVPELAESWQTNDDQTIYTFTLKENITWHDGQPLSADDVIFTFQSLKDPDFKSPLLISFRGVEVEKVDDRTIKFILPEPFGSFLEVLTVGILPEHIWAEIPPINANLTEYNLKPIGTGAWKFKSLSKDRLGNIKSYTIEPNSDYYGPKPYLEKITFKFYPDFETAVAALKNHSVEGLSFLPKELKSDLAGQKNLKFQSFYLPQYTAVFFNQKQNEILKDKNVRKALAFAIDKAKILSDALALEGEIIDGPILPLNIPQSPDKKISFNPNQANQLLDEANWEQITPQQYQDFLAEQQAKAEEDNEEEENAEAGQNQEVEQATTTEEVVIEEEAEAGLLEAQSFYRQKDDNILELTLTTVDQPENVKAGTLIAEFWQNIGVKVNLQIIEGNKISREIIKPRNYEILLFGIIVGSNPDPYHFWHSSQVQDPGLNLAQFANREVDKLLEDARQTNEASQQQGDYKRFQDILATEIPAIFLYNPTYTYVTDQKIKGSIIDRIIIPSDRFNDVEEWYIKTKRRYHTEFN